MNTPDKIDGVENLERSRMSAAELSWSLRAVIRAATDLDQALAVRMGLRPIDYAALTHVMSAEADPIGPAELGHRLGITTGSATELVDRLERTHHIRRERTATDRRRVSLVAQGQAVERVLGELGPLFNSLDELAADFDDHDQDTINRYLRAAIERVTRYTQDISP